MQNKILLPYYLQQREITKAHFIMFTQISNTAQSLQMKLNPYLMGGSSNRSEKQPMVFTETDLNIQ